MEWRKQIRSFRIAQVRVTSGVCIATSRTRMGARFVEFIGNLPGLERALVGFRRGFPDFAAARRCAAAYGFLGQEHPISIRRHSAWSLTARPSDYAAMFHMERILPQISKVIDLGGAVGNLFYSYSRYLSMLNQLEWIVVDIPAMIEAGQALAEEHGARNIRFVTNLEDAGLDQCERTLLLISGALHYFDQSLGRLLRDYGMMPAYVLVNRSPVSTLGSMFGIQDAGEYATTARVLDRHELLDSMEQSGYRLVDEWIAAELNMRFPLRPQHSVEHYSGFLFSRI